MFSEFSFVTKVQNFMSDVDRNQGRTGPSVSLELARWAGWSSGHVGRHVKY